MLIIIVFSVSYFHEVTQSLAVTINLLAVMTELKLRPKYGASDA